MATFKDAQEEFLKDPHVLLGYMSSSKGTKQDPARLRDLFNHAGQPVPTELAETQGDSYEISRSKLAGLVYQSAKKNGHGIISRSSLWLKTRLA